MTNVPELFGSMVFNQKVMKERLSKETYNALKKTLDDGVPLNLDLANQVAHVMKEWAIEKGATHYTHWFQPLTGITAEKHDSYITPQNDGTVIMTFSSNQYYPVLNWIMSQGQWITPLKPQQLVDEWKENVKGMYKLSKYL